MVATIELAGQFELLEVVGAGDALGLGLCLGQGRQEHARQDGDDGDHDQKLDEGKPTCGRIVGGPVRLLTVVPPHPLRDPAKG